MCSGPLTGSEMHLPRLWSTLSLAETNGQSMEFSLYHILENLKGLCRLEKQCAHAYLDKLMANKIEAYLQ